MKSSVSGSRERGQSVDSYSSIDSSDDDDDDGGNEGNHNPAGGGGGGQKAFFADIEAVIDHVNGKKHERLHSAGSSKVEQKSLQPVSSSDSDGSSDDSSSSSDDSLIAEGMVSNATQMNIGAFIDSLNNAAQNAAEVAKVGGGNDGKPKTPPVHRRDAVAQPQQNDDASSSSASKEDKYTFPDEDREDVHFEESLLNVHIEKAVQLSTKEWPEASDLEYVIFYARKDKVPVIPILDAFDEQMRNHRPDIPMSKDMPVKRLSRLLRQTVKLVETNAITAQAQATILKDAEDQKLEISMFKAILKNPQKHVRYIKRCMIPLEGKFEEEEEGGGESAKGLVEKSPNQSKNESVDANKDHNDDKENLPNPNKSQDREASGINMMSRSLSRDGASKVNHSNAYYESKMDQLYDADRRACKEEFTRLPVVDGVDATRKVLTTKMFKKHPFVTPFRIHNWKLPNEERCRLHQGFKGIRGDTIELAVQADQERTEEDFEWDDLGMELTSKPSLLETADFFGTWGKK